MLQDLAALTPPAIVCVAFLVGAWALIRRELAPRRRARAQSQSRTQSPGDADAREPADHEQGGS